MMVNQVVPSSFRDPSGFVFYREGIIYRQVNEIYKDNYDQLIGSGLYKKLVNNNLLISHEEVETSYKYNEKAYKVIKPEVVNFISYPYEWCFSQLKNAALATLQIQKHALNHGMTLKDCSAYNIQFINNKPVFIDTLSFEKYQDGSPWVAYKQFCQHFLAPLALAAYKDIRLNKLLQVYLDGIPLDMASELLPSNSMLNYHLYLHLQLHSKAQKKHVMVAPDKRKVKVSEKSLFGIIDSLETAVKKINWNPHSTYWVDYYDNTNYDSGSFDHKKEVVSEFLDEIKPKKVWDLGANTGVFSRIASSKGIKTLSFDIDPGAVEKNYIACLTENTTNLLPLLIDLTNPSPSLGWANEERMSIAERGPVEMVLALALIHHLAIANNTPLEKISDFFARICKWLIVEFVPKKDSQVERLLSSRVDIFHDYNQQNFELEFGKRFRIKDLVKVNNSDRYLYLMFNKQGSDLVIT